MDRFKLSAVGRTPQAAAAPTLTELGPLVPRDLSWRRVLNAPPELRFSVPTRTLQDDIRARLLTLDTTPLEVWLHLDGELVEQAFVQAIQPQGDSVIFYCPGVLGYLAYWFVVADVSYSATDQFTIGKALVNQWQALSYGNFGIVTTGITTSGVTRTIDYVAAERHNVLQRLQELGGADDGFDIHVNQATRALVFSHPQKGSDLTGSVILDSRNITNPGSVASVAPGDVATEAFGVGTGPDQTLLTSTQANTTLRGQFGRVGVTATFDNVPAQATLDGYTQALLDARAAQLFMPAPGLRPIADVDVDSFDVGDTVAYVYDDGLGERSGDFRVSQKQVDVDLQGRTTMAVAFA